MKKYLIQFKPFLIFVSTFFAVYIALTMAYKFYLDSYNDNRADGITAMVSHNVEQLMLFFNSDINIQENLNNSRFDVTYNGVSLISIVEGCNAVSVIILFISFVLAFSGKFKKTLLFILFGILSVYILNVVRIALLTLLFFHFPKYNHLWHGVVFPLLIYGYVFVLWIIWINKFSKYAK
ncbi:exosortase family protein XrtF [Flavobacterium reichenbachii]|uniref:Exosortase n=1 Tax=Flavobacterium reichenbachii TaxID=362418 RepID=A0A085ZRG8_9FLAO|nr:exosortase family protein XrtF [Flavobacterium reichenbachii]KFF07032.1 exosortase [Flavobacterium reichenbachii]OXB11996.1 exosortase family protein XrtF [Flavobacterium reichenbachii]